MSNRNIENKIEDAFNHASLEQMEDFLKDIQAENLEYPNEMSKKRMKKKAMKKIEARKEKNGGSLKRAVRALVAVAAAFAVIVISAPSLRLQARDIANKLFSFIPGVGIEENKEPQYILSEKLVKKENDKVEVELTRVSIEQNIMTIQYKVDMKLVDTEKAMATVEAQNPQTALLNYYEILGYSQYFDLSDMKMKTNSSLSLGQTEIKKTASETFFNEQSAQKTARITEWYNLEEFYPEDIQNARLMFGDIELTFSLEKAKEYSSKDELLAERHICSIDGVSIMCEQVWDGDELRAEFYMVDTGKYMELESLSSYANTGVEDIYVMVDGNKIAGKYQLGDACANTYTFDMTGYKKNQPYEIYLDGVSMIEDKAFSFDINEQEISYEGNKLTNQGMASQDEASQICDLYLGYYMAGDILKIKYESSETDGNRELLYFQKGNGYNNALLDEKEGQWAVFRGQKVGKTITLTNPVYRLHEDFVFEMNKRF